MKNQNRLKIICNKMENKIMQLFLACFNHEKLTNEESLIVVMNAFYNTLPIVAKLTTDIPIDRLNNSEKRLILLNILEGLKDMLIEALDQMKPTVNP